MISLYWSTKRIYSLHLPVFYFTTLYLAAWGKVIHVGLHDSFQDQDPTLLCRTRQFRVFYCGQSSAVTCLVCFALFCTMWSIRTASVSGIFAMFRDPWLKIICIASLSFNTSHVLLYINITSRSRTARFTSESMSRCSKRWIMNTSVTSGKRSHVSQAVFYLVKPVKLWNIVQMILKYQSDKQWRGLEYILVVLSNSDCHPELCNSQRQEIGNGEEINMLYQLFLSLRDHHLQLLTFCFDLINNNLPAYFINMSSLLQPVIYHHNIRQKRNYSVARVNYVFAQKCMRFCIPDILNKSSSLITDKIKTHSRKGFSVYLKCFLVNA